MTGRYLPLLLLPLCLAARPARAQDHLLPKDRFDALSAEVSGERALGNVRRIVDFHRIQGSPMMADVARGFVLPALKEAGLEAAIEEFPSDGRVRYGTHVSPPGWTIRSGELWVEGKTPLRLCRYADVPMCVSTYSKGGAWAGELVDVGRGTRDEDYAGIDVRGKVALGYGYAAAVARQAVLKRGAAFVVIYPHPADRPSHPDLIRYNGMWPRAEEIPRMSGGFQISANQYHQLRAQMAKGPVRVRGRIDAAFVPGSLTVVHAYLRGQAEPEREVLLTAHLDHPKWSANDNASGAGLLVELARALRARASAGLRLRRTIHFMWIPEFYGTLAWVSRHPEARACGAWDDPRPVAAARDRGRCILANLNLDMVGEDAVKTGGRFYATRAPDSVPSALDALLSDVIEQTREAHLFAQSGSRHPWEAGLISYAQGSDHDVLLGLGVPGTMLGHLNDWTHHSSEDTIDKVDASELLRVGALAGAAAELLATAEAPQWRRLRSRALGAQAAQAAERLALLRGAGDVLPGVAPLLRGALDRAAAALAEPEPAAAAARSLGALLPPAPAAPGPGPRRRVILPLSEEAFATLPPEDRAWLEDAEAHLGERLAPALLPPPSFGELLYETVNLVDGRRRAPDIAAALRAEFLVNVDDAWVARALRILTTAGLLSPPPGGP